MINTLNESALHKTLKTLYCEESGGECEMPLGPYTADVVTAGRDVIEIQTGSLSPLLPKIKYFLSEGRSVRVVYPLVTQKTIETRNTKTLAITRRRSPVHPSVYTVFHAARGLWSVMANDRFCLEVLFVKAVEERKSFPEPVQTPNGARRFKKNWLKCGKRLEEITARTVFCGLDSYRKLFPPALPNRFTRADFFRALKGAGQGVKQDDASLFLWTMEKAGLVRRTGRRGRSAVYVLCDTKRRMQMESYGVFTSRTSS